MIRSHDLWQRLTEKVWEKHRTEWWAVPADLWNATSQQAWKNVYTSMLVRFPLCYCPPRFDCRLSQPLCMLPVQRLLYSVQLRPYNRLCDKLRHSLSAQVTWRMLPSQRTAVKFLTGHTQAVTCLTASSQSIASGSADRVLPACMLHTCQCTLPNNSKLYP